MPRTEIETKSQTANSTARTRTLTLAGATLTTGLITGVFYSYASSVSLGLASQPDTSYIATMQSINEKIQNPVFFLSFFGALLFPPAALALHYPLRRRSGRFGLIALACVLYIGGGFLLTVFVNVPMNEELARVSINSPTEELARARTAYEGPWNFWNAMRTVLSLLSFIALVGACLLQDNEWNRA